MKRAALAWAGGLLSAPAWAAPTGADPTGSAPPVAPSPAESLRIADRIARWIDRSAQDVEGMGVRWPADPLAPDVTGINLYGGTAGIVYFFAALGHYAGDAHWKARARAGADYVAATLALPPRDDPGGYGLYTGEAGAAWLLARLAPLLEAPEHLRQARRTARRIVDAAQPHGRGVEWSELPDLTMGGAGIGLFLLHAGRAWRDDTLLRTAERAGHRLIELAEHVEGGWMWTFDRSTLRNYPNFSHGTAGVAYYLAELHRHTGRPEFLQAALRGAAYLEHVAHRDGDSALVFHRADGGLNRYYVSWCHGPVGTARLFYRLHRITGDARWAGWVDALTRGLLSTGAPFRRSDGYWDNVGQCCGNAGIAQYYIDLIRHWNAPVDRPAVARVIADALARASHDEAGLPRWVHAESRDEPDHRVAQTGFMQGSAGMGTLFLQWHALQRGATWDFPFPDTPFASRPAL